MAKGRHPARREENDDLSPSGEAAGRRRFASRCFFMGIGTVVLFALLLAAVSAIVAQSPSGGDPESPASFPDETPAPTEVTVARPEVTLDPEYAGAPPGKEKSAEEPQPEPQVTAVVPMPEPTATPVEMANPTSTPVPAVPVPPAPAPEPVPTSAPPAPAPQPAPAPAGGAARLAAEANEAYGVRIVLDGQDWGANDAAQVVNVQAVIRAIDGLPHTVISTVVVHSPGPLTFVSNDQGRTAGGWQPYGEFAIAYYTNFDQDPGGYHASNQVVLSVGAGTMSIGHEMLHAYQFRNVGPDEYALALLQPEMRSFMEATGWRQTGSDDDARLAAAAPWSALDSLYVYEGRPLSYVTSGGASTTISVANPIEAFAIAGSIYYTRPSWMPLPDWPEYWDWFSANVG